MKLKVGYSAWGFLGDGIIDTPDGGRSHRGTLIKNFIKNNCEVVMLQKNRDLLEANDKIVMKGLIFDEGLPVLDAVFIEYRWRIPGRNCDVDRNDPKYTPDFDRQNQIIDYYVRKNIPILIWDKDQKIDEDANNRLKDNKNIIIFESSFGAECRGRKQLFFPMDGDMWRDSLKKISEYKKNKRKNILVYIGNQYERDGSFKKYFDEGSRTLGFRVPIFGNWTKYSDLFEKNLRDFPHVDFKGKVAFKETKKIYSNSLCTVLIAPDRYYKTGQFTQRIFEAISKHCIPLFPREYEYLNKIALPELIVDSGAGVADKILQFSKMDDRDMQKILEKQILKLKVYLDELQIQKILKEIKKYES